MMHSPMDFCFFGEGGEQKLSHEMGFEVGFGGVAGFEGIAVLFGGLEFLLSHARLTGKFAEIFFPFGAAGHFFLRPGAVLFGAFAGIGRGVGSGGGGVVGFALLKEGIFQQFPLHRFHQFLTGEQKQGNGLLEHGRHVELLAQFELLFDFKGHNFSW